MLRVEFCILKEDKDTGVMIQHRLATINMTDHLDKKADCNLVGKAFRHAPPAPPAAQMATIVNITEI